MADSTTPLINGRAYDWSMIEIYFGFASSSEAIYGIKAVKWERKRKVESNYGIGSHLTRLWKLDVHGFYRA